MEQKEQRQRFRVFWTPLVDCSACASTGKVQRVIRREHLRNAASAPKLSAIQFVEGADCPACDGRGVLMRGNAAYAIEILYAAGYAYAKTLRKVPKIVRMEGPGRLQLLRRIWDSNRAAAQAQMRLVTLDRLAEIEADARRHPE